MRFFERANTWLGRRLIGEFERAGDKRVRVRYGLAAGWVSIVATTVLFAARMTLGLHSGSISIIANAFHLLSHLATSGPRNSHTEREAIFF